MQKPGTHFEQIPVEIVKKIARLEIPSEPVRQRSQVRNDGMTQYRARKTKPNSAACFLRRNGSEMTDSSEMEPDSEIKYPEWQKVYFKALVELDNAKLPKRLAAAHTAISKRLQTIPQDAEHHAERLAIDDALANLRALQCVTNVESERSS